MQEFTGWEYLLIDAANNHWSGLDKKTFEERVNWANDNLHTLETQDDRNWKERPLYLKAVMAIRKAQAGEPTGHLVGFDAVCSGMQIMSAATGCHSGANATGLVDPNRRADAYTDCTNLMIQELGYPIDHAREHTKQALMTSLYGSKAEPKKEFGDGTPELAAFYKAMYKLAPGACELLDDLLNSWQPYALLHEWILPDGYHARVKVMQKKEHRIEVEELGKASFTYQYYENEGEAKGVKNAANVVHSLDAYVLRSLVRRCNYDRSQVEYVYNVITDELLERAMDIEAKDNHHCEEVAYFEEHYARSKMADVAVVPYITRDNIRGSRTQYLRELKGILDTMLEHKPFEIVTIHDDFKCHPNNMNWLRKHYRNILAEIADSEILSDIFTQLHGRKCTYQKLSNHLGTAIRQSNYALS